MNFAPRTRRGPYEIASLLDRGERGGHLLVLLAPMPGFDTLRGDARFASLVARAGLPSARPRQPFTDAG